jgi:lysozyme family protein
MSDNFFEPALAFVLAREGGWYDGSKPRDPNPTMKGITLNTLRRVRKDPSLQAVDLQRLTDAEIREIYRSEYWVPVSRFARNEAHSLVLFDTAVNFGPDQAIEWANMTDDTNCYLYAREAVYRWMTKDPKSKMRGNRNGWLNRVKALRKAVNL